MNTGDNLENNKLFVYGILKRGFELDLARNDAKFIGEAHIQGATLYHIGRGVGLRFTDDDTVAHGELWEVPDILWKWLDSIEANGFAYTRKIVEVQVVDKDGAGVTPVDAWVYEHTYPRMRYTLPIKGGKF